MTQEDLASRAGLHSTYVSRLEGGLKSPTLDVLVAIAGALGLTTHRLIQDAEVQGQAPSPDAGGSNLLISDPYLAP